MTIPNAPTAAAMSLDIHDLPVGTFVRWNVDTGFGRGAAKQGEIVSKTDKTYKVRGVYLHDNLSVRRDPANLAKRNLRVLATAQEWAAMKEANAEASRAAEVERRVEHAEKEAQRRTHEAERKAKTALIVRYSAEYDALVQQFLTEEKH